MSYDPEQLYGFCPFIHPIIHAIFLESYGFPYSYTNLHSNKSSINFTNRDTFNSIPIGNPDDTTNFGTIYCSTHTGTRRPYSEPYSVTHRSTFSSSYLHTNCIPIESAVHATIQPTISATIYPTKRNSFYATFLPTDKKPFSTTICKSISIAKCVSIVSAQYKANAATNNSTNLYAK